MPEYQKHIITKKVNGQTIRIYPETDADIVHDAIREQSVENSLSDLYANKQDTLTAGEGIDITNNVISNTQTSAEWGNIEGEIENQIDLQRALNGKQNVLIAGNAISINNDTISVNIDSQSMSVNSNNQIETNNIVWRTW